MHHLQQRGHTRLGSQRARCVRALCSAAPRVIATREHGKNGKLVKELAKHGVQCLEMPLIEHAPGPDRRVRMARHAPGNPASNSARPTAGSPHEAAGKGLAARVRAPCARRHARSPLQIPAATAAAAGGLRLGDRHLPRSCHRVCGRLAAGGATKGVSICSLHSLPLSSAKAATSLGGC